MKLKDVLPDSLSSTAKILIRDFKKRNYEVTKVVQIDSVNTYKMHLMFKKGYEKIAIEIRERCDLQSYFERVIEGCHTRRVNVKIYFAVPEKIGDEETVLTPSQITALKKFGIGLFFVGDGGIREEIKTISCNNRYVLEEGSSLGKHTKKIMEIIERYNNGDCYHAVSDLTIEVEEATDLIASKAVSKTRLNMTPQDLNGLNWENKIDLLSTNNYRNVAQTRYFAPDLTRDLKSFKDTRNFSHHPRTAKQKRKQEQQYLEKMMQGIRLLRELVRIRNSVR